MANTIEWIDVPEYAPYVARVGQALSGPRLATWQGIRVAAVSNGACALSKTKRSAYGRGAHAHCYTADQHFGLICVWAKYVRDTDGKLSSLMWHELAHLLAPNQGHSATWRARMAELGYPNQTAHGERRAARKPRHWYRVYCWDHKEKRGRGDYLVNETKDTIDAYLTVQNAGQWRFYFYAEREWNVTWQDQRNARTIQLVATNFEPLRKSA